jgi:hypothetical protein
MEHRWGGREATDVAVRFFAFPSQIGSGRVVNISVSGAFLETALMPRRMSLWSIWSRPCGRRARVEPNASWAAWFAQIQPE